jgi:hypothetical protein
MRAGRSFGCICFRSDLEGIFDIVEPGSGVLTIRIRQQLFSDFSSFACALNWLWPRAHDRQVWEIAVHCFALSSHHSGCSKGPISPSLSRHAETGGRQHSWWETE